MKSFQSFRLDVANHCLWRGEERVIITPKAFDVLRHLVENAGRLVTQSELLEALWPETYVNQEVLRKYILEIRKVLGDRPQNPEFIETVIKRGYRFIAPVTDASPPELADLPTPNAAEEKPGDEAAPSSEESSSEKRTAWKLVLIPTLALIVVLVCVASGFVWFTRRSHASSFSNTSIAVLPFTDMSPGKDQEYFADGLSEQLINDLAKVSGLKVVARSSAFQFKGQGEDLRAVGQKLGVANVLEGSVRKDGDRVRITASLTKVDDGFQ
ncbi:MAG: winged helix-turn-helix domain-containing protein, partial [Candidatus Acidiferrales bacterium]